MPVFFFLAERRKFSPGGGFPFFGMPGKKSPMGKGRKFSGVPAATAAVAGNVARACGRPATAGPQWISAGNFRDSTLRSSFSDDVDQNAAFRGSASMLP